MMSLVWYLYEQKLLSAQLNCVMLRGVCFKPYRMRLCRNLGLKFHLKDMIAPRSSYTSENPNESNLPGPWVYESGRLLTALLVRRCCTYLLIARCPNLPAPMTAFSHPVEHRQIYIYRRMFFIIFRISQYTFYFQERGRQTEERKYFGTRMVWFGIDLLQWYCGVHTSLRTEYANASEYHVLNQPLCLICRYRCSAFCFVV